ncbi:hypothetical protein [Candidatus Thiosymbion oneisti]|uniref:hypothetical protein n=1 Tax=Candidatus Thiosymbion oneisti TaxID=589554 RepID=UPI001AAD366A|nr:hypothetical protein [Candidatus Thiosymbion oneisti]
MKGFSLGEKFGKKRLKKEGEKKEKEKELLKWQKAMKTDGESIDKIVKYTSTSQ